MSIVADIVVASSSSRELIFELWQMSGSGRGASKWSKKVVFGVVTAAALLGVIGVVFLIWCRHDRFSVSDSFFDVAGIYAIGYVVTFKNHIYGRETA